MKTASADPIEAKRAEAQNVLAQIQAIDGQLEQAVEAYNLANVKLDRIQGELKTNAQHLVIARKSLNATPRRISRSASSRSTSAAARAPRSRCSSEPGRSTTC